MVDRKTDGTFMPGTSGNPNGRPRVPRQIQQLKETARVEVLKAMAECLLMNKAELQSVPNDPNRNAAQRLTASILINAINSGCPARAQFFMNYILGKPLKGKKGAKNPSKA